MYQGALPEILLGRIVPALQSIYGAEIENVEARSRLTSVLDVCEHEMEALDALVDARLTHVLQMMTQLRAEIVATLATLTPEAGPH
jgi:hypothetical protein